MPVNAVEIHPADRWASTIAQELTERMCDPAAARICLPTGRTMVPIYAEVVHRIRSEACRQPQATIVLLDEFVGLAPDDPARCEQQLRRGLIDLLNPPPRFISIDVDGRGPSAAAAELDHQAVGLDLAVVGLGANGHVGMNEPGSDLDSTTRVVDLAATTGKNAQSRYGARTMPTAGVTVGITRLLEARDLWLVVNGRAKAEVLAAMLNNPMTSDLPASWLRAHTGLRVIVDSEAAQLLDVPMCTE